MSESYQNYIQAQILQGYAYGRAKHCKERTIVTSIVKATKEKRQTILSIIYKMRKDGETL